MEQFRKYEVLTFPDSVTGRVENSLNNPFNKIIPFEEFMGFEHDCSFSVENTGNKLQFCAGKV